MLSATPRSAQRSVARAGPGVEPPAVGWLCPLPALGPILSLLRKFLVAWWWLRIQIRHSITNGEYIPEDQDRRPHWPACQLSRRFPVVRAVVAPSKRAFIAAKSGFGPCQ